jgi:probable DNA repair protein
MPIEKQIITREALHAAMAEGIPLVTGNVRLSRALLSAYEQGMVAQGQEAWPTPELLPWDTWLLRLWEDAVIAGRLPSPDLLLNPSQELHLWESIIEAHPLLRKEATARSVREAWQLIKAWCVKSGGVSYGHNEDTQAFQAWARQFEVECKGRNWFSQSQLLSELIRLLDTSDHCPLPELLLIGFDELEPAQQELIEALQQAGASVRWLQLASGESSATRLQAVDSRDEIDLLSRWVRQRLNDNHQARIGIVVLDLTAQRPVLELALAKALAPQSLVPGAESAAQPWNTSLGRPLSSYPVVQAAFWLLRLTEQKGAMEEMGALLRSPYLAGAELEAGSRALLDGKLRENGEPVIGLKDLHFLASQHDKEDGRPKSWTCPELAKHLGLLLELVKACPARMGVGHWASWFTDWLGAAGWPAGRSLNSDEFQTVEAWRKLLVSFGSLDVVSEPMSRSEALSRLRRMAASSLFQPKSEDAPVQVLGLYEAIGLEFDHLWVMGLHDGAWPSSPRPNPFIPLPLQRAHDLPHSCAVRELVVAKRITERLSRAATEVVVSYPGRQGEEELSPSPLIVDFPEATEQGLALGPMELWRDLVRHSADLQQLDQDPAPPLAQHQALGGSAIFKHQSLCPFRAFAEHRLGAKPLAEVQIGLDAMERGSLLHRMLELFWREVKDQDRLLAMSDDGLEQTVREKVEQAIIEQSRNTPQTFSERFKAVETERLVGLARQWLELEGQRAPFEVIEFERMDTPELNGVQIRCFIDRVDQMPGGDKVVIDYKSGKVSPGDWFGERPEDPQLPLYSAILDGPIAAVLFGQIRADELAYKGVVKESGLIPGLPSRNAQLKQTMEEWPAVLETWKETVARLAGEFRAGQAAVDPKNGLKTCDSSYCPLAALCRIHEQPTAAAAKLEGEGDE